MSLTSPLSPAHSFVPGPPVINIHSEEEEEEEEEGGRRRKKKTLGRRRKRRRGRRERGRRGGKRKKKKGGRRKETLARKQVKKTGKGHGGFNSKFQFHTSYLSRKRKRGSERRGREREEEALPT